MNRAARRAARRHAPRIRNRWARIGTDFPTRDSTGTGSREWRRAGCASSFSARGPGELFEKRANLVLHRQRVACLERFAQGHHAVEPGVLQRMTPKGLARHSLDPVAIDGAWNQAPRKREAKARIGAAPRDHVDHGQPALHRAWPPQAEPDASVRILPVAPGIALFPGAPRHRDVQTATRLRPWARRPLMTARPLAVFMRTRKPCVFLRWVVDGWKVRFIAANLGSEIGGAKP